MKFLIKVLIGLILLNFKAEAQVPDGAAYLEKILQQFVKNLEKTEITGNGLPLADWIGPVNASLYGVTALGTVKFNSGFVNSIEKASLETLKTIQVTNDYVRIDSKFYFQNVRLFYDMDIELSEYTGLGNIMILVPKIEYVVYTFHHYKTNVNTLDFNNATFMLDKVQMKQYPNNGYTQLINKQFSVNSFRAELLESIITGWIAPLQKHRDDAIATANNPELCYYCNQLDL